MDGLEQCVPDVCDVWEKILGWGERLRARKLDAFFSLPLLFTIGNSWKCSAMVSDIDMLSMGLLEVLDGNKIWWSSLDATTIFSFGKVCDF